MPIGLRFLIFLAPVIAVAIFTSLKAMEKLERQWLTNDLARRSRLVSESTHDYLVDNLESKNPAAVKKLLNRISRDERLTGALVCSPEGKLIAKSDAVPSEVSCASLEENREDPSSVFTKLGELVLHRAAFPIASDDKTLGHLIVLHDTSYMNRRHETTKSYLVVLLCMISLLFFGITLAIYRWSMSKAVNRLKSVFKSLVSGETSKVSQSLSRSEFSPLAKDLSKVMRELRHAKEIVKDSESGLAWNPSRLRTEVQKLFGDSQICVIANREPYVHNKKGSKIEVLFPASGLVTAVEPIVRACSGLWIAHGSGTADRQTSDASGKLLVPPEKPEYALKRVWLTKTEEQGYYYGFSNEGLWPLCHIAHARPHFESEDWKYYSGVNEKFARAFVEENPTPNPIALIQDYHFALLPQMIREKKPGAILSLFWHIPWPNPEAFGICPWRKELLTGMLGSDLIGFHTQFHCNNFLDTVDRYLEARVDREQFSVTIQGHVCYVKPFPISIEWPTRHDIPVEAFPAERAELLAELNLPKDIKIGIGVDRVDYTKGIIERLRSVERFLEKNPSYVGKFVFVQIGAPSRTHIKRYQDLNAEVQEVADEINWKFSQADTSPILLMLAHHNAPELFRFYRAAEVCFVSSLHDGMNLVAKEYISAHGDLDGTLILSTFTGASRELTDALLVNPYDIDECSQALHTALSMPQAERRIRMERLRKVVSEKNVYGWAGSLLAEIDRIARAKNPPTEMLLQGGP
ncbi:MAG: trehalose-6-phosphate synthase [Bdellovibrionota bacterium]